MKVEGEVTSLINDVTGKKYVVADEIDKGEVMAEHFMGFQLCYILVPLQHNVCVI